MEDILKSNFIESVKGAEKSIYTSCIISITLYGLAILKKIETVKIPFIDIEIEGSAGLLILLVLYGAIGIQLCMYLERAKKNLAAISNPILKQSLLLYPSITCGSWPTRVLSTLLPSILFIIAMNKGFDGNLALVSVMVAIFSMPYFVAIPTISGFNT